MLARRTPTRLIGLLFISALTLAVMAALYMTFNRHSPAQEKNDPLSLEAEQTETVINTHRLEGEPASANPSSPLPDDADQDSDKTDPTSTAVETGVDETPLVSSGPMTGSDASQASWQLVGETKLASPSEDPPFDPTAVIEQSRNAFQVDTAGRPFIQQPRHEAVFDAGHLQFTALVGERDEHLDAADPVTLTAVASLPLRLDIELAQIKVGNQESPLVLGSEYEVDGNVVRATRGAYLVEEFVARDVGIEQQWRLTQRPEAQGDFALTLLAETPLSLRQAGGDFIFQVTDDRNGPIPVIRYRRAVAIDAAGDTQWAQVTYEQVATETETNQYLLTLTFSEVWLAEAEYPVLIDPLISNLIRLEQDAPANDQSGVEVAYNPDQDEFLVVWQDYRQGNWDIYGQRVRGDGTLLDENFIIRDGTYRQSNPRMAYGNGVYLVAWRHYPGPSTIYFDVYGAVISSTGQIITDNLAIAADNGYWDREYPTDVIYNPDSTQFLVLWADRASTYWDVWGRHLTVDGAMGTPIQITSQANNHEAVATGAYNPETDEYLITWESWTVSDGQVKGQRLTGNGTLTGTVIDIGDGNGNERQPTVVHLDAAQQYVVAWHDDRNGGTNGFDIYSQLVNADGTLDGNNTAIATTAVDEHQPRLALDSSTGGAVVGWRQNSGGSAGYDLYGRYLDNSGQPIAGSFSIQAEDGNQHRPVLAQNSNGDFLTAWYDERNGNQDIFTIMKWADGSWSGASMAHPAPGDQEKPQIAYNPDDDEYLVVWQDFRSSTDWDIYGQRVGADGSLIGQNLAIDTTTIKHQTNPRISYGANEYMVAWQHYVDNYNTNYLNLAQISGSTITSQKRSKGIDETSS